MKLTKKAAALLLAASLAVSVCATPVFAENAPVTNNAGVQDSTIGEKIEANNINNPKQACTQLKYTVTEGYTWSIPKDIVFDSDHGVTKADMTSSGEVTVKNCRLKNGYNLKITIAGNGGQYVTETTGGFKVKTKEGAELPYTVNVKKEGETAGHDVVSDGQVLSIAAGKSETKADLTFTLKTYTTDPNAAETAGEYIGYAIFTAKVDNT